jgi:hypothetical protein
VVKFNEKAGIAENQLGNISGKQEGQILSKNMRSKWGGK